MSSALRRRLELLEAISGGGEIIIVSQFVGMNLEDAMRIKFGDDGPPRGARLVIIKNALPEHNDQPYDWSTLSPIEYIRMVAHLAEQRK